MLLEMVLKIHFWHDMWNGEATLLRRDSIFLIARDKDDKVADYLEYRMVDFIGILYSFERCMIEN